MKKVHENFRHSPPGFSKPCPAGRGKKIPCLQCGSHFSPFSQGPQGWNIRPHAVCVECFCLCRKQSRQKDQNVSSSSAVSSITDNDSASIQAISQISVISCPSQVSLDTVFDSDKAPRSVSVPLETCSPINLNHHIFSSGDVLGSLSILPCLLTCL